MFLESDPSKEPEPSPTDTKPLDLESPNPKSRLFDGGSSDPTSKSGGSAPQELTLSYLCENPKLNLQGKDTPSNDFLISSCKSRCKGKEVAPDSPAAEERRWVERDFLQLAGGKRENPEGPPGDTHEKKAKMETLSLSLAPPNLSLSLDSSIPPFPNTIPAAPNHPSSVPLKRNYSNNTRTTNSDDYAASLSYSYSVPYSHNPSCSLTRNSTENYGENDQMWYAGEGTNGSVHSRFKPIGDGTSITFSNHSGYPHMPSNNKEPNNSLYRANSSENHSFFPSELPARQVKVNGVASTDSGRNGMLTRPDRVLREIISESVPIMAQMLQEFPSDSLEAVKEFLRKLMGTPEKKDEFTGLQRRLERRSDLTSEILSKSHKVQLEILVATKTGIVSYLSGKTRVPANELVEIFLLSRCRNINCKSMLPVDDCDCKICSTNKGFCSACMCPVCFNFDCASNTCSWVGCDVCSHWCHAVCGIEKNLIRPGASLKGAAGMTEMQFHCLGCGHDSEMFGFVKEVFNCCAKDWGLETLMKELDCVVKIFSGSQDFEGKELQRKAEEMLTKLGKKHISPLDACKGMLQFFKYGASDFSVTGSSSKNILATQASQHGDMHPLPPPTTINPPKPTFNLKPSTSILDSQMDALKPDSKPLVSEPRFALPKEEGYQSLETMVKFKEAEAKLFQRLADDARREVEGYHQIVCAKSEKLEEEYVSKLARLCLQETEERRRKKLEELKFLENSHCDYHNMKVRMQAEIAGLLERIEATKKQWV